MTEDAEARGISRSSCLYLSRAVVVDQLRVIRLESQAGLSQLYECHIFIGRGRGRRDYGLRGSV